MAEITWGRVWKRASALGLRLDQLGTHGDDEKFWLVGTVNRSLAEIAAELDEREAEAAR